MGTTLRTLFPTARRLLVARGLETVDLSSCRDVLVVGAGKDPYRRLFPAPRRYVRLDIVPRAGSTDVAADAHRLPFAEGSFDCILASEVLEHLASPAEFVASARRALAPGGRLVLTVPFLFHRHADPFDFSRLTPEGLVRALEGFSEVTIRAQGNRLHVVSDLLTTAFAPRPVLFPLRALNHLLVRLPGSLAPSGRGSTAPSGFLVVATR